MKHTNRRCIVLLALSVLSITALDPGLSARTQQYTTTTVQSVSSLGVVGSGKFPSISGDGRFITFISGSASLVPGDTNGVADYFVRDRLSGTTTCLSNGLQGQPGNGQVGGYGGALSDDGAFAVFTSMASNLVDSDTNGKQDVFVHELASGATTRVSVSSLGQEGNDDCGATGGYPAPGGKPVISADGRYVAFDSLASNLVFGDTNGVRDIFVRDRTANSTTRVSLSTSGAQNTGASTSCAISADGRYVAFDTDTVVRGKVQSEVFVHDRQSGATIRASLSTTGGLANGSSSHPALSGNGRYLAFESTATNLVPNDSGKVSDVFIRDLWTGVTSLVSLNSNGAQASGGKSQILADMVSSDGRYVLFWSEAKNLVPGDTNGCGDWFVRDRVAGTTARVSVGDQGQEGNAVATEGASIRSNGMGVAFCSWAGNLVPGWPYGHAVYLRE